MAIVSIVLLLFTSTTIPALTFAEETNNNVALDAEVIEGENAEEAFPYENIVDGNMDNDSRLSSEENTKPSVTLKLKEASDVQFFRFYAEERDIDVKNNIKKYQVTFSEDEDFTDSVSVTREIDEDTIRDDVLLAASAQAEYVKIEVLETHGSSWDNAGIVEFELYEDAFNMALDANATGENAENDENTPDKAIDGKMDTLFSSSEGTVPTLILDLGEEKQMQFLRLLVEERNLNPKNNLKNYTITFSNDEDFNEVIYEEERTLENDGNIDDVQLSELVEARYVMLSEMETHGGEWDNVAINEFEIYDYPFTLVEAENDSNEGSNEGSIDDIVPTYDADANKVVISEVEGYSVENNGADFEQIIDKDFNVYRPLTEKEVNVSLKITNDETDEVTITDDFTLTIPGKYEENEGNTKPVVAPELSEWYSDTTDTFTATENSRIVIDPTSQSQLERIAKEFQVDYEEITGRSIEVVYEDTPNKGDFYLTLQSDDTFLGDEGYHMDISDAITVSATHHTGAYWATRSILQILVQDEEKQAIAMGETRDYPKYEVRGFLLDVARKPFSMEMVEDFAKNMAWYKMNDLQIHLSDNYIFLEDYGYGENELEAFDAYDAFRLESDYTNENGESATAKDYAYSKEEFKSFILDNRELGFNIVPEIDIPAHANSFTKVFPEMMVEGLVSPLNSERPLVDHIDISKPEVVDMVKELFDDYTKGSNPTFDEQTVVHIGADEFLSDYTAYRDFINEFVPYIKETNAVRMWGGLTWIKDDPVTEIEQNAIENVQMNLWSSAWADGIEMYDMGYDLINTIDSYLYMVPNGSGGRGAYNDYLDTQSIYNNFEPNIVARANGAWEPVPSGSDQMLGAVFAIWNDNIDKKSSGLTEVDMYKRFHDALPVLAEKTWANGQEKGSLEKIQEVSKAIGFAPQSNPTLQVDSMNDVHAKYTFDEGKEEQDSSENGRDLLDSENVSFEKGLSSQGLTLQGNESYIETPLDKVGEDNTLSFDMKLENIEAGQILFEYDSPYGTHDIRVMEDGKLGFTRELHDYTFDYELPEDEWVHVELKTSSEQTVLYINDEQIGNATGAFIHNDIVKKEDITNATFALPIQRIGSKENAVEGQFDNIFIGVAEPDDAGKVPSENIEVKATSEYDGEEAVHVIDGDKGTIWHSDWSDSSEVLPQTLTFTFKEPVNIERMSYLPRQDGSNNGSVKTYDIYITDEDGNEEKVVEDGSFKNDKMNKMIRFDPVVAKEVRFVVTGSYGDTEDAHASAAEVAFFPTKEEPEPEVNKDALAEAIEEAESKDEADYTESSWKVVAAALEIAQATLADDDANQDEVDKATEALNEALENLEADDSKPEPDPEEANKAALEKAVKAAESKEETDYTESSWKALASALEVAQATLADDDASQDEVDEATEALKKALENLQAVDEQDGTDENEDEDRDGNKEKLEEVIKEAESKKSSDYTKSSWKAVASALEAAQKVLADENASQDEIDEAFKALHAALEQLEKQDGKTNDNDDEASDNELPKTATNIMNFMLVGFVVMVVGLGIFIMQRRQSSKS